MLDHLSEGATIQAADAVEDADLGCVEDVPDVGDRDYQQSGRSEISRPDDAASGQSAVGADRHEQCQANADQGIQEVVGQHPPESGIKHHGRVVFQTYEPAQLALPWGGKQARRDIADNRVMGS